MDKSSEYLRRAKFYRLSAVALEVKLHVAPDWADLEVLARMREAMEAFEAAAERAEALAETRAMPTPRLP